MSKTSGNNPQPPAASGQKPQAASHMFWFFILPCLVFLFWASYKLVNEAFRPKPERDIFSRLEDIQKAKNPGDRWKAAYNVSQELQKIIRDKKLEALPPIKKEELYSKLDLFLREHKEDLRLKRYLLLTLGQMGEARALPSLEEGLQDKDPELRFFAAWGYLDILNKQPSELSDARAERISSWLEDTDNGLKTIAITFLVQKTQGNVPKIRKFLESPDQELKWNTAVALASVKDKSSKKVLLEIFDLKVLRAWAPSSQKSLEELLAAATEAAIKLGDPEVLLKAQALRASTDPNNPEGRSVRIGLAKLPAAG